VRRHRHRQGAITGPSHGDARGAFRLCAPDRRDPAGRPVPRFPGRHGRQPHDRRSRRSRRREGLARQRSLREGRPVRPLRGAPVEGHAQRMRGPAVSYWLFKTEPETFSWEMQKQRGSKGEPWSGVRNFTAARNMKAMKKGDLGFFYHTGDEKQIVGIVEVIAEYKPDPT